MVEAPTAPRLSMQKLRYPLRFQSPASRRRPLRIQDYVESSEKLRPGPAESDQEFSCRLVFYFTRRHMARFHCTGRSWIQGRVEVLRLVHVERISASSGDI